MFLRESNRNRARRIRKRSEPLSWPFVRRRGSFSKMTTATVTKADKSRKAPVKGRFGVYGGRYVPETLMAALEELEREYDKAKRDRGFQRRLDELLRTYAGRPTPLFFARRLTRQLR